MDDKQTPQDVLIDMVYLADDHFGVIEDYIGGSFFLAQQYSTINNQHLRLGVISLGNAARWSWFDTVEELQASLNGEVAR